tara:strand:+ start:315 stop:998 length:684 start_codon:yes stop_codon:yes gene_type:complete
MIKKIKISDFKGLAFDLDDTLIDRETAFNKIFKIFYKNQQAINKKFTEKETLKFFWDLCPNNSIDISYCFETLKKQFPEINISLENFYKFYYETFLKVIKPHKGVIEFLDKLIEKKVNFGIVTNGNDYQLKKIETTGLKDKYNFVIASEIFGHSKPKIEIFQETLRLLKLNTVDIDKVLFIGDNPYTDIIGAKSYGFKTAWIRMKRNYPKKLDPPDYIIDSYRDLLI